jgi:hypothetical protein
MIARRFPLLMIALVVAAGAAVGAQSFLRRREDFSGSTTTGACSTR